MGKKLSPIWRIYYQNLVVPQELDEWKMGYRSDMRIQRNVIAHNFNTGQYYHGPEEDFDSEDNGPVNRTFSAGTYWDFLEKELPPLISALEIAIERFEEAIPHIAVKVVEKSEEEKEEARWEWDEPVVIPHEWSDRDWEWSEDSQVKRLGFVRRYARVVKYFFARRV
ncbi:hypothetical protein BKA66DRAFT_613960 [Pyrenochaeta sp. MPI-SDFR-AT-0127]|nr:hypothetical protein BKA66DRAFT_613960 [Pyrenochaeta sp. MPI-SDFR-AT-0127]